MGVNRHETSVLILSHGGIAGLVDDRTSMTAAVAAPTVVTPWGFDGVGPVHVFRGRGLLKNSLKHGRAIVGCPFVRSPVDDGRGHSALGVWAPPKPPLGRGLLTRF